MTRKKKEILAPVPNQAPLPSNVPLDTSEHMNYGKCNSCQFSEFMKIPDPLNWANGKVYMKCGIYNEIVQLTKCVRDSEEERALYLAKLEQKIGTNVEDSMPQEKATRKTRTGFQADLENSE